MAKRPPRRKPARKVPSPTSLRKLRPAELEKLGLSRKSERYVRKGLKHPSKRSPTYSKRQYLKGQRGGVTHERHASARMAKSVEVSGASHTDYPMPLSKEGFTRRLKEIQGKHPGDVQAYLLFTTSTGHAPATRVRQLQGMSYAELEKAEEKSDNRYRSDFGTIKKVWLRVRVFAKMAA